MNVKSEFSPLEARVLLTSQLPVRQDFIYVKGTKGDDVIDIRRDPHSNKRVLVTVNGVGTRHNITSVDYVWIDGGRGNDRIIDHGGWNAPRVISNSYYATFQNRPVFFNGGAGDDVVECASWTDLTPYRLEGGSGNDVITARGSGKFELIGGTGDDQLHGGDRTDTLTGDDGDDSLYGGAGEDLLVGGDGADLIDGQKGKDTWAGVVRESPYIEDSFPKPIRLTFDGKPNDGAVGEGDNVRSVEVIGGSAGADTIDASGAGAGIYISRIVATGADSIIGSAFADYLHAGSFDATLPGVTIRGGGSNDTILGEGTADSLFGDDGDDMIGGSGSGFSSAGDHIEGGAGDDSIKGGVTADYLDGGIGNDTIDGEGGRDTLIGYAGNDLISVAGPPGLDKPRGPDVRGGSGRDTLNGKSFLDLTDGDPSGFEIVF